MEPATLKLKSFSKKCALLYPNKYSDAILEPTEKKKKKIFVIMTLIPSDHLQEKEMQKAKRLSDKAFIAEKRREAKGKGE